MQFDWLSVFSVFNAPKISRALSSSDTQNIRLAGNLFQRLGTTPRYGCDARSGLDTVFSVQDPKTETLASTSASIVKAGLNKVWLAEPKGSSHFEAGLRVPLAPLQKAVNEKQPELGVIHTTSSEPIPAQLAVAPIPTTRLPCLKPSQCDSEPMPSTHIGLHLFKPVDTFGRIPHPEFTSVLTRLPLLHTGQPEREPYTPADPQHSSGSRFLSFSLQKAAKKDPDLEQSIVQPPNLETSRTSGSLPHPATAPSLARLLLNAREPEFNSSGIFPRQILGSFYLPTVSSPQVIFPLAQSLLFLPPSPPPPKKFIFNPFSPEEDTVLLPPALESRGPQFGITYPVQNPDHKFPINTPIGYGAPPSLDSTQSSDILSPLSIALLLSPAPLPPSELIIKIAGPEGYLNADHHKLPITHFLSSRATEISNSLVIVWQLSHVDSGGARGLTSLKAVFAQLDEKVIDSDRTPLSSFSKLSITIPDLVKDVAPYDDLLQPVEVNDSIDLTNAANLLEFTWHGDFVIFASKFKNLSFETLTCLHMKSSDISIEDAITLLHSCSDLQIVSLGTIRSEEDSEAVTSLKPSGVDRKALPNLTHLSLESDVALHPLMRRLRWTAQVSLSLTLRKQGTAHIHKLPLRNQIFSNVELICHLTPQELISVQRSFPLVKYHEIGI